ncbi:hypothetical protein E4T45_14889 [Aureobasidium sp. EXF-8846]|nr:hypothetical protein E4T45_14889 [Aureobasidium sp. EXF-8846]
MGASLLVFKNKSDVAGCMSSEEIGKVCGSLASGGGVSMFTKHDADSALRLDTIQTHRWNIMECSALTGLNLQEGLKWVVQDAKDRLFLY